MRPFSCTVSTTLDSLTSIGVKNGTRLGMSNRSQIHDAQIRSSATAELYVGSHAARLDDSYGWVGSMEGDYIEVDLRRRALISEIWTQGAAGSSYWTRNFTVEMSNDGVNFVDYEEFAVRKVCICLCVEFLIHSWWNKTACLSPSQLRRALCEVC